MGHFDIDGVRLWDRRDKDQHFTPAALPPENLAGVLESDSVKRADSIALVTLPMDEAQRVKEDLEN